MEISPDELTLLADHVRRITGIHLDQSKKYLVESRFRPLIKELGLESFRDLNRRLASDPSLNSRVIDAITTRETYFFRDSSPFEALRRHILPEMIARKKRIGNNSLKIWSAACSSGQEVYSTAILLRELLPDADRWNIRLLGTDISDEALTRASYGKYSRLEVERGLPPEHLNRWFLPEGELYKVRDELRYMVSFQKGNLLESFTALGSFDIILARNVAIYFTQKDKIDLFDRISVQLDKEGALLVGASESLTLFSRKFRMVQAGGAVYYMHA